jgi:hypothetical protein
MSSLYRSVSDFIYTRHAYESILIALYGGDRCHTNPASNRQMLSTKRLLVLLLRNAASQLNQVKSNSMSESIVSIESRLKRSIAFNQTRSSQLNLQTAILRLLISSFAIPNQSPSLSSQLTISLNHSSTFNFLPPTTSLSPEFELVRNGSDSRRSWPTHLDLLNQTTNDSLESATNDVSLPRSDSSSTPITFHVSEVTITSLFSTDSTSAASRSTAAPLPKSWIDEDSDEEDEDDPIRQVNRNRWPDYKAYRYSDESLRVLIDSLFNKMGVTEHDKGSKAKSRILTLFELDASDISFNLLVLLCYFVFFRFLACLAMRHALTDSV